jgi:hypothetical protein
LHPENFQRYLDEIDFIKKEVFKFVDRFFSELSLEFVNMWEAYLLKFTTGAVLVERIEQLIKWIRPYTGLEGSKSATIEMAKMYVSENFEDKVNELMQKSVQKIWKRFQSVRGSSSTNAYLLKSKKRYASPSSQLTIA